MIVKLKAFGKLHSQLSVPKIVPEIKLVWIQAHGAEQSKIRHVIFRWTHYSSQNGTPIYELWDIE